MPQTTAIGPLLPIGPDDLKFVPVATDLNGLAADSLSDLPNLLAAMDADLAAVAENITAQIALSPLMDGDLNDLAAILGEIEQADFSSILVDLAGIAAAGDGMLTDFSNLIGG